MRSRYRGAGIRLTELRFFHVIAFAGPARLISPLSHQNQARSGLPWFVRGGSPHVIPLLKVISAHRRRASPAHLIRPLEGAEGHAPNPTKIRVLSVEKSLKIEPFTIPENLLELGRTWRKWINAFEDETSYVGITERRDRVSALKIYGGKEIKTNFYVTCQIQRQWSETITRR